MHTFRAAAKPVMGTHGFVETFACEHYRRSLADTKNGYKIMYLWPQTGGFRKQKKKSSTRFIFFPSRQFFLFVTLLLKSTVLFHAIMFGEWPEMTAACTTGGSQLPV